MELHFANTSERCNLSWAPTMALFFAGSLMNLRMKFVLIFEMKVST